MSKSQFSEQEIAFFDEGDTLSETCTPAEDFSDRNDVSKRSRSWASRAMSVLSLVGPARS